MVGLDCRCHQRGTVLGVHSNSRRSTSKPAIGFKKLTKVREVMTIETEVLKDRIHLIIHDDASPDGGGIQNMAYWIARYMGAKGQRVVVAGRLDSTVFTDSNVEVFALKKPFRTTHSSDIRLFFLLARLRIRYGQNVILYSLLINNIKVFRWLRGILGWNCVSFLHGNETLRLLHQKPGTLRKNLLACLCVFANSRYTAGLVEKFGPLDNLYVLSPGIPTDRYSSYSSGPGQGQESDRNRKTILMLSRLVKRKGHSTVIQSVSRLREKHPDILLLIAGSGGYRARIEEMTTTFGLKDHVKLLGFVSESDKLTLYDSCSVYCMPSEVSEDRFDVEGFGITFIEASAMGKIAIGTDSGGIPDAIEDGRSGFLIKPGDVEHLTHLLGQILSHPEKYDHVREYGKKRALETYGWDTRVDRILEKVSQCLQIKGV